MKPKGLKIFTQIFSKIFITFLFIALLVAYITLLEEIDEAVKYILEEYKIVGNFILRFVAINHSKNEIPFEILKELSRQYKDVLFWWVIKPDGVIHIADNTSFVGTNAYSHFPKIAKKILWDKDTYLDYKNKVGILILPFNIEGKNWSFWLGFSLDKVFKKIKNTLLSIFILFFFAMAILGISVYFGIRKILNPIKILIEGLKNYGEGNFDYRINIRGKNEIVQLANHFNQMAENLKRITVSRDVLAKEIEERKKIEMQLRASEQQLKATNQQLLAREQQLKALNQQLIAEIKKREKLDEERKKYIHELEIFYNASVGREERILELKKRIKELEEILKNKEQI
ncbi:MAG: HAMP domain-containing protein [Candidatus Omnitrophica bacterium]|nr:HAMP domain-containing protein [Candidatus Omnitrophota bacterium]